MGMTTAQILASQRAGITVIQREQQRVAQVKEQQRIAERTRLIQEQQRQQQQQVQQQRQDLIKQKEDQIRQIIEEKGIKLPAKERLLYENPVYKDVVRVLEGLPRDVRVPLYDKIAPPKYVGSRLRSDTAFKVEGKTYFTKQSAQKESDRLQQAQITEQKAEVLQQEPLSTITKAPQPTGILEKGISYLGEQKSDVMTKRMRGQEPTIKERAISLGSGVGTWVLGTILFAKNIVTKPVQTIKSIPAGIKQTTQFVKSGGVADILRYNPEYATGYVGGIYATTKGINVAPSVGKKVLKYPKYETTFLGKPTYQTIETASGTQQRLRVASITKEKNLFTDKYYYAGSESVIKAKPVSGGAYEYTTGTVGSIRQPATVFPIPKEVLINKKGFGAIEKGYFKPTDIKPFEKTYVSGGVGKVQLKGTDKTSSYFSGGVSGQLKDDWFFAISRSKQLDPTKTPTKFLKEGSGTQFGLIKDAEGNVVRIAKGEPFKSEYGAKSIQQVIAEAKALEKPVGITPSQLKPVLQVQSKTAIESAIQSQTPKTNLFLKETSAGIVITKTVPRQEIKQTSIVSPIQKQPQELKIIPITKEKIIPKQIAPQTTKSSLKFKQITPQVQVSVQKQQQKLRQLTRQAQITTTPQIVVPPIVPPLVLPKKPSLITKVRNYLAKGYTTFYIRGGKKLYLPGVTTKEKALKRGEKIAKSTLAVTFGVEEEGMIKTKTKERDYKPSSQLFRDYRISQKQKVALKDMYIQRKGGQIDPTSGGARLGSFGEIMEIKKAKKKKKEEKRKSKKFKDSILKNRKIIKDPDVVVSIKQKSMKFSPMERDKSRFFKDMLMEDNS